MTTTQLPLAIWLLSAIICACIARYRGVRNSPLRATLVALIGPFAIPWVLVARADAARPAGKPPRR